MTPCENTGVSLGGKKLPTQCNDSGMLVGSTARHEFRVSPAEINRDLNEIRKLLEVNHE